MKLTTAKLTGLFYLGLAITGMVAYLFARDKLYVEGDAVATAANLIKDESMARVGIAAEVALVGFQALAAVWFYKLFRKTDSFSAGLIGVFGMVNAVAILIASAMWVGALNVALAGPEVLALGNSQLLFDIHEYIWQVAALFFGLWLIPMGYVAMKAKFPTALGWFLIAGGVGYVLSTFVTILLPEQTTLAEVLPMPATVGEFWMIGYLLFKKVKI
ncbi:DUF4386 domain-containing protein [Candidatus Saccharibacteria bacterium]|nr:DUF4386 domain-containing protein [Candidatus Saccharibacteria bacterium]